MRMVVLVRYERTSTGSGLWLVGAGKCLLIHSHNSGEPTMQTEAPTRHLLTRREASEYLAISPRKLDSLVADGELPRVKIGTSVRFEKSDLDAFIAAQKAA